MSYADQVFRANCLDILQNGVRDDDLTVRPHWEDGTPAHTVKKFGLVNRYDLQKEFPILTLRRTYLKSAVDELLWIWQKKSNNVHDLSSTSGMPGRTKPVPSARPTAISLASSTNTRRVCSIRSTACSMTSDIIPPRAASSQASTISRTYTT